MRTFLAILTALTIGCASSPQPQPSGRIALVTNRPRRVFDPTLVNRIQAVIHATAVVDHLSEIDESSFDTVVVLRPQQGGLGQPTYDVTADRPDSTSRFTIGYEVRRAGAAAKNGSIGVVMTDPLGKSRYAEPYLEGLPNLLRDVSNSTPPAERTP